MDLQPQIEANKNELLALLREEVHGAMARTPQQPYPCSRCRGYFGEDELAQLVCASGPAVVCQNCWPE